MKLKIRVLLASVLLVLPLMFVASPARAYGVCVPDLDGGCRYCEIKKNPFAIWCTTH